MKITLVQVPYNLKEKRAGIGLGPMRYMEAGLAKDLKSQGHNIEIKTVKIKLKIKNDLDAIIKVNVELSNYVKSAAINRRFPLIISGNCSTCLGVLSGLNSSKIGIIWFDAHGDFNTPEISPSGFLDGMPLAIATGQCYAHIWKQIGNYHATPESSTSLIGVRDLDLKERKHLEKSKILIVPSKIIKKLGLIKALLPEFSQLRLHTNEIYLHFDIDALDPIEAPGVNFRCKNGLFVEEAEQAIQMVRRYFEIKAVNFTAYNPRYDNNNKTLRVGLNLMTNIVNIV